MENIDKIGKSGSLQREKELFSRATIPWKKSKEESWIEISARIPGPAVRPPVVRRLSPATWAIAATLLVMVAGTLFLRLYTTSISTADGIRKSLDFSDGSSVSINGGSKLSYHPFWWRISRTVELSGEGFFEVEPGGHFVVRSGQGSTTVLGTTFNILARNGIYEVSCLSGKVRVESRSTDDAVILLPDEKATLNEHGKLDLEQINRLDQQIPWIRNEWIYTDEPLVQVMQTIENLYDIKIILPAGDSHRFTGGFDRTMPAETVLDLVCTPFGFTFTKKADGVYEVHPK